MLADSSLLLQMQLALIGIVLVTGLFYLWRSICRIEDKVTRISMKLSSAGGCSYDAAPQQLKTAGGSGVFAPQPASQTVVQDFRVTPMNFADADSHAEELMKQVFGDEEDAEEAASAAMAEAMDADPEIVVVIPAAVAKTPKNKITILEQEEAELEPEITTVEIPPTIIGAAATAPYAAPPPEVAESEADTEGTNPLSKSKLNKMNAEELKNLCTQRGLSGEGSKKILVDRLLGISRD